MKQQRPVNLDLTSLKFPPMAIASILHRISGILLFLLFPFMLYLLDRTLHSPVAFQQMKMTLANPFCKLTLWVFAASWSYHVLAGIRHMIMDLGFGEQLQAGRQSAIAVIILAVISTLCLGWWIW